MSDPTLRTGQLLLRHRDGGIIRETHIGDLSLPQYDGQTWHQHMTELAAELRRVANELAPPATPIATVLTFESDASPIDPAEAAQRWTAPHTGTYVWINGKPIGTITGATIERADGGKPIRMGSHAEDSDV